MYMSQHIFTPDPAKMDLWAPYNRNYMSLMLRAEGAVLSRILRAVNDAERFYAVGNWTGHEIATEWMKGAQSRLGAKPNVDQALYGDYPMYWSRWNLVDFAWGMDGPQEVDAAGVITKVITWGLAPGLKAEQRAVLAAVLAGLARHPGFVCGETYLGHREDRYELLYTFRAEANPGPGDAPLPQLALLMESDTVRKVRSAAPAPEITDCTVWDWVPGPDMGRLANRFGSAAA